MTCPHCSDIQPGYVITAWRDHERGGEVAYSYVPCPHCHGVDDAPIQLDPQERAELAAERDYPERKL